MNKKEALIESSRSLNEDCSWFNDWDISTAEQNSAVVINKIYDDFDSRICENCKFFDIKDIDSNGFSYCDLGVKTSYKDCVCKTFGCNDFERNTK